MGATTVIVTDRGSPVSGLPVFFHNPDGSVKLETVTSLSGASGLTLEPGSFVTVMQPRNRYGIDQFSTFSGVGVVGGPEVLHLDLTPRGPQAFEVDVTVADDGAGAVPYVVYTTCTGEEPHGVTPGMQTRLSLECASNAQGQVRADFLAVRLDPDTNEPVRAQFLPNVDVVAQKTITFPAGGYTPVDAVTVNYSNFGTHTFVHTYQSINTANGRLFESFEGGHPTLDTHVLARPQTTGTTLFTVSSTYPLPDAADEQLVYRWIPMPGGAPALSVDVLGTALPSYVNERPPSNPPLAPIIGQYDIAGKKLVWKEKVGPLSANFVRVRAKFHRADIPVDQVWSWQVIAARGTAPEVKFPALPTLMPFDFNPAAGDVAAIEELTNIKLPAGLSYDTIRAIGFADVNTFAAPNQSGTMIVQRRFIKECDTDPCPTEPVPVQ